MNYKTMSIPSGSKYSEELLKEAELVDKVNKTLDNERYEEYKNLIALAEKLYRPTWNGKKNVEHSVVKYLKKNPIRSYYVGYVKVVIAMKEKEDKEEAAKIQKLKDQEKEIADFAAKVEAIEWLKAKGIEPDLHSPIKQANEIAFDEEVARLIEEGGHGVLYDFDGQNCNDYGDGPCDGWDGSSRRCQCGNRRVYWTEGWSHSYKEPDVRGEAY